MAIVKCSECWQEVSDKAEACPKCGNPIAGQLARAQGAVASIVGGVRLMATKARIWWHHG